MTKLTSSHSGMSSGTLLSSILLEIPRQYIYAIPLRGPRACIASPVLPLVCTADIPDVEKRKPPREGSSNPASPRRSTRTTSNAATLAVAGTRRPLCETFDHDARHATSDRGRGEVVRPRSSGITRVSQVYLTPMHRYHLSGFLRRPSSPTLLTVPDRPIQMQNRPACLQWYSVVAKRLAVVAFSVDLQDQISVSPGLRSHSQTNARLELGPSLPRPGARVHVRTEIIRIVSYWITRTHPAGGSLSATPRRA
jgi:hypothetical protein